MKNLTKQENELYKRIGEVLFYVWDPIGVYDEPAARDEYDSYIPQVFSMLKKSNSKKELLEFLSGIEKKQMRSETSKELLEKVVNLLIEWKAVIFNEE